jgi:hypothetical protein
MDARDPIETYFLLNNIDLHNVKEIYFGLDPWIYVKRYYLHRNSYLYLDFSFIEALKFSFEHDKSVLLKRYLSFIWYAMPKITKNRFSKRKPDIPDDFGSVTLNKSSNNFSKPVDIYSWFQIEKYGWSQLQFQYLTKIQNLCRRKDIEFSVFVPPKRADYSIEYKAKCGVIHREYVKNLTDADLNSQIFGKFDQLDTIIDNNKFFCEAYHLNSIGQKVYSGIFYNLTKSQKVNFSTDYSWFVSK